MKPVLIYITTKDREEAERLGRALVTKRIAACVNILGGEMKSIYWWEGRLEEARESVLIAKTEAKLVDTLIAEIKTLHSYDCPCVLVLPTEGGNPDYLAWLNAQVR